MGRFGVFIFLIFLGSKLFAFEASERIQFAESFDCEARFIHITRCISTKPKEFTAQEKDLILKSFTKLFNAAYPLYQRVFEKNDVIIMYRHTNGYDRASSRTYKKDTKTAGWVDLNGKNIIHLTDLFFNIQKNINPDYTYHDYLILHESAHLFDNNYRSLSKTEEFLSLYQWEEVETGESFNLGAVEIQRTRWQTKAVTYVEVDNVRAEVNELFQNGFGEQATEKSLSFGQDHGHPTSYSMTNPFENFAEIITHYFIDPASMETVPADVVEWLDSTFE